MTWFTIEVKYDGLPLLLRKPNHTSIWSFEGKFNRLVSIEHTLDKVTSNGLPEKTYNATLTEFDHHMCTLLEQSDEGIIILIETFSGKRNYYYYTLPELSTDQLMTQAENKFAVKLRIRTKLDTGWDFLRTYPFKLYSE